MGTFARAIGLGLALVAIAVGVGVATGDVKRQFEEEGVLTWFSTALLLACSGSAWQVFRRRGGAIHAGVWRESRFLWALIGVAFVFLAADELLKIHETADHAIHDALGLVESRLSDRIDDAIVGVYGLAALLVLWLYRAELRFARPLLPFLGVALICFFGMVAGDLLTSTREVWIAGTVRLSLVEDALKVIAECLFLAGFRAAAAGNHPA